MSEKTIKIFKLANGKEPFNLWLRKIKDKCDQLRILRRIDRLALGQYGDTKTLSKNLYELRFFFGPGYRIYFTEQNHKIVILLLGGDKKSQEKDIKQAKDYLAILSGDQSDE